MISVKISPAGRPLSLARGLPVTVGVKEDAKVLDVKAAIAAKFPKVGRVLRGMDETEEFVLAQRISPKTHAEG
jgi:hypothetical protein